MASFFAITIFGIGFYFYRLSPDEHYLMIKERKLSVEVASVPYLHQQGLMGRQTLAENRGMLFIYPYAEYLSFWMKDTLIPLSLAFIRRDGTISQIMDMNLVTHHENPISYRAEEKVPFAVEVNQGWFSRYGVGVGDRIIFSKGVQKIIKRIVQE